MASANRDIVHVVERCRGGVATYVTELMRRQRDSGDWRQVSLVADPRFVEPALGQAADAIQTYDSSRKPLGVASAARAVQAHIDRARPALVHLHSSFPGVYGRLFAPKGSNAPAIVYCPHGWAFEMQGAAAKQTVYAWMERSLAPKADVIVSISEHERLAAERRGLKHPAHVTISHGVRDAFVGPPLDLGPGLNLLFVGRFDRQKGLDLLLKAMALSQRQDVRLHLIGGADQGDTFVLPDDPRIVAHGWVAHDELDRWYKAADAVVMPSRWEGFGLVAIEAMRNGTPVLASARGALPDVVGDAGLIFDPEVASCVAALIDGLDSDTLAPLGSVARARFLSDFTAERAAAELDAAYALAAERRLRRPGNRAQ